MPIGLPPLEELERIVQVLKDPERWDFAIENLACQLGDVPPTREGRVEVVERWLRLRERFQQEYPADDHWTVGALAFWWLTPS